MNRHLRQAIIGFALISAGGLAVWMWVGPEGAGLYTDGWKLLDERVYRSSRRVVWEDPIALERLATPDAESSPALAPDGLTLFFTVGTEDGGTDLWAAILPPDGPAVNAEPLRTINSSFHDRDPFPTTDALFFSSNRPGSTGGFDLWVAPRH